MTHGRMTSQSHTTKRTTESNRVRSIPRLISKRWIHVALIVNASLWHNGSTSALSFERFNSNSKSTPTFGRSLRLRDSKSAPTIERHPHVCFQHTTLSTSSTCRIGQHRSVSQHDYPSQLRVRCFPRPSIVRIPRQFATMENPSTEPSPKVCSNDLPPLPVASTPYADPENYFTYRTAIDHVIQRFKIKKKKDTPTDVQMALSYLQQSTRIVPLPSSLLSPSLTSSELKSQLDHQKQSFMEQTGLNQRQTNLVLRSLTYLGDYCAKTQDAQPLLIAWDKLLETGSIPNPNALGTYLYVLGRSRGHSSSAEQVAVLHDAVYQPTENTVSLRIKALVQSGDGLTAEALVRSLYHSTSSTTSTSTPTPTTTTTTITTTHHNPSTTIPKELALKLRTCLPLFRFYCHGNPHNHHTPNIPAAFSLYTLMRTSPMVHLDDDTYALFLSTLAQNGCFRTDYKETHGGPIPNAVELGYPPGYGPKLLDRLLEDTAGDVLELRESCVRTIRNGFAMGWENTDGLETVPLDCTLVPVSNDAFSGDDDDDVSNTNPQPRVTACRVVVNHQSGLCNVTNTVLRSLRLEDEHREHIRFTLVRMAGEQFEAFGARLEVKTAENRRMQLLKKGKEGDVAGSGTSSGGGGGGGNKGGVGGGKKAKVGEAVREEDFAAEELKAFVKWLDEREGKPFTAIVDGANVAYHRTGTVNYKLIRRMVNCLEAMGETVLVVMPQKYAQKRFYLRRQHVQELGPDQMEIVEQLKEDEQLYLVPAGCLDDYYWMVASVADQTTARRGSGNSNNHDDDEGVERLVSLDVPPGNKDGRWPGARPSLVSNDQMRDHRLELLEPRLFGRWASTHVVNYHIPNVKDVDGVNDEDDVIGAEVMYGGDEDVGDDEDNDAIRFSPSEFFSHEIQGNRPQGCNDEDDGGSLVWHIPVSDWGRNDRFCIRIPSGSP